MEKITQFFHWAISVKPSLCRGPSEIDFLKIIWTIAESRGDFKRIKAARYIQNVASRDSRLKKAQRSTNQFLIMFAFFFKNSGRPNTLTWKTKKRRSDSLHVLIILITENRKTRSTSFIPKKLAFIQDIASRKIRLC